MMDLLTLQLDDLGQGRGPVLAVLAIVLAAIAVVMLRDLLVWFEGLGKADDDAEGDATGEDSGDADDSMDESMPIAAPAPALAAAPAFVDRRNPANAPTGFGRRRGDVIAASPAQAA